MKVITAVWGALLLDEDDKVQLKIAFPKDPESLSDIMFQLDQGVLPKEMEALRDHDVAVCDNATVAESLGCRQMSLGDRQDLIKKVLTKADAEDGLEFDIKRGVAIELVRRQLKVAASSKDLSISQAINSVDELDQTINLFTERLVEWYGIHFPELEALVPDNVAYCETIANYGFREDIDEPRVAEAAKNSMGAQMSAQDIEEIKKLARAAVELARTRQEFSDYIEENVTLIAPNMTALVGPLITARLMALAGGLRNLAQKPASTIQMLGAEKALFRHLKTGAKPPKHGIIFQWPDIHNAKPWHRGKIARTLASELAIAARVDYRSGGMVADELSKKIEARIKEIKEKYPYPPRGKAKAKRGGRRK